MVNSSICLCRFMKQSTERAGPRHLRFPQGDGRNLTGCQKTPKGKVRPGDQLLLLFIQWLIHLLIHLMNTYFIHHSLRQWTYFLVRMKVSPLYGRLLKVGTQALLSLALAHSGSPVNRWLMNEWITQIWNYPTEHMTVSELLQGWGVTIFVLDFCRKLSIFINIIT